MKEQFCSYEIALKLKELGFYEKCVASYYTYDIKNFSKGKYDYRGKFEFDYSTEDQYIVNSNETYYVSAPLWQQVIDWLREEHNIHLYLPKSVYGGYVYVVDSKYSDTIYNDYYDAREQAILKALELCKKNYHKK